MDAILALRLLSEIHREFNRLLAVAYVDIKAAFDSVDRKALWLAMRGIGVPEESDLQTTLYHFNCNAHSVGLNVSWAKTKIQRTGGKLTLHNTVVDGQTVEAVDEFIYLGSKLTSDGRCIPDILRRIGITSASMNDLNHVWAQKKINLSIKL